MIIIELFICFSRLDRFLIEVKDLTISALEKVLRICLASTEIKGYDWLCNKAVITVKFTSVLCIIPVRNKTECLIRIFLLSSLS